MRAGERKLATLLFADLSGYTDMTRRLDPEDVVSVVDPVMRDLQRVAEAHGGTVLMTAGDGVLCAFGVPLVREDDALRAVRAAAEMRELGEAAAGTSGVHIGIASGEILITPDGSPRGWGITGLCVALAARLSDLAVNGEILADEVCRRLAGPTARWGPERGSQLQGMGEHPVRVAELLDLDGSMSPRARGPLVGRQVEQARLDELLTRVIAEEESAVVSVWGEAGIGKSRLVEAWLEGHPEVTAITGRCHPYGDARPLAGLLDAVLEHVRVRGLLSRAGLAQLLSPLAEAEGEALGSRLLALAAGEAAPPAEDLGSVLNHALRSLLVALTPAPVVLVVDDVHWGGHDVHAFLNDLDQRPLPARLLVVAMHRDGPYWADLPALAPLPDWAGKQLIEARLPIADASLVQDLVARTGGNPLYLVESLNLLEDGVPLEALVTQLPPSVRALLAARLDSLPPDAKEIALVSSAGADLASKEALTAMVGRAPDDELQTLVQRGVLVEVTAGCYRFGHRLFQEAAYSALTRTRRVELHLGYLDLLDQESPSLRAFHAESAWRHLNADSPDRPGVAMRALTELHELGESMFAWQASGAKAVFQRAEEVATDLPDDRTGVVASMFSTHAQVLVDLGDLQEALQTGRRAREAARDPDSEGLARLAVGHALARLGQMEEARAELQAVLVSDDPALRGRALKVLALTWRFESEERFCRLLEEAFAALEEARDQAGQAEVARLLAYLLSMSGSSQFEQWYDVATASLSLDDLRGRALMVRTACFAACAKADWPDAGKLADEALVLGRRAGVLDVVVDSTLAGIAARTYLGNAGGALALRSELVAVELPPRGRLALSCASALAFLRTGDSEAAVTELGVARLLAEEFGDSGRVLERQARAEVLLDAGRAQAAEPVAREGLIAAQAAEATLVALQFRLLLCRIAWALGESQEEEAGSVLAAAEPLGAAPLVQLARVLAGQAAEPPAEGIEARAHWYEQRALAGVPGAWERAREEWARLGSTAWAERALLAMEAKPTTLAELAALPVTPLIDDLTVTDA